jgi:hypothetical protein
MLKSDSLGPGQDPDSIPYLDPKEYRQVRNADVSRANPVLEDTLLCYGFDAYQRQASWGVPDALRGRGLSPQTRLLCTVPVGVSIEPDEYATACFGSIARAADNVTDMSAAPSVAVFADYNYPYPDMRRQADDLKVLEQQAAHLAEISQDALEGHNVRFYPHTQGRLQDTHIAGIRSRDLAAEVACGLYGLRRFSSASQQYEILGGIPRVSIDVDSTVNPEAFSSLIDAHELGEAIILNGTIRYTSPTIEADPNEVASMNPAAKMVHLFERLRRMMFDHLGPFDHRGYMPESGHSLLLGNLVTLGGYDARTTDSEWFGLHQKALTAVKKYPAFHDLAARTPKAVPRTGATAQEIENIQSIILRTELDKPPLIDRRLVPNLGSIECYLPPEEYTVTTSARSIEAMVALYGIGHLIRFDQGDRYTLYNDIDNPPPLAASHDLLPRQSATQVLGGIYSYFAECGGRFDARDAAAQHELVTLFDMFFPPGPGESALRWPPVNMSENEQRKLMLELKDAHKTVV